ncbi:hypothetical protein GX48_04992 [Paracoccidioides brasiliensis]|nr:hypothetical protein GX48_04992 [Paracoccidioides brasiliensis]
MLGTALAVLATASLKSENAEYGQDGPGGKEGMGLGGDNGSDVFVQTLDISQPSSTNSPTQTPLRRACEYTCLFVKVSFVMLHPVVEEGFFADCRSMGGLTDQRNISKVQQLVQGEREFIKHLEDMICPAQCPHSLIEENVDRKTSFAVGIKDDLFVNIA